MVNGYKIRTLREVHELSLEGLAYKIGVTSSALSYFERGFRQPSSEVLKRIADEFGVTMNDLMAESA